MPEKLEAEIVLGYRGFTQAVDSVVQQSKMLETKVGSSMDEVARHVQAMAIAAAKDAKVAALGFRELSTSVATLASGINVQALSKGLTDFLAGAATGSLAVAGNFEQLQARLISVTGSTSAAFEKFQSVQQLAVDTPFDLQGLVAATSTLEGFKLSSEKLLPVAAKLAAGLGTDLKDATLSFSKAAAGSADGFTTLRDAYGITARELLKFGAAEGKVAGELSHAEKDIERNREALVALINTRFGDALERQSRTLQGAMSNVKDSADTAAAGFGQVFIPIATLGAKAIAGLLNSVSAIPAPLKALGAAGAVAVGGVIGLGAAAGGTITALVLLQAQFAGTVARMGELGIACPVATAALGRMGAGLGAVRGAMTAANLAAVGLRVGFLGLAAVVAVVGTALIDTWEKTEQRVGDAITGTANKTAEANKFFRDGVAALNKAGGEAGNTVQILGDAGAQMDQINAAFSKLPAGDVVRGFLAMGITAEQLKEKLKSAGEGATDLRSKLLLLMAARDEFNKPGGTDPEAIIDFQNRFREAGIGDEINTIEDLDAAIGRTTKQYARFGQEAQLAKKGLESFDQVLVPLQNAVSKSAELGKFLDLSKQVNTAQALAGALASVQKQIAENSKLAQIGTADLDGLLGKLASPTINLPERAPEKAGLEAQLKLVQQRDAINRQITDNVNRAAKEQEEIIERGFRRRKALGEVNLHDELRFVQERLAAATKGSEDEVRLLEREASLKTAIAKRLADLQKDGFKSKFDAIQGDESSPEGKKIAKLRELKEAFIGNAEIQKTLDDAVSKHKDSLHKLELQKNKELRDAKKAGAEQDLADIDRARAKLEKQSARGNDVTDEQAGLLRKRADAQKVEVDVELKQKTAELKDPGAIKAAQEQANRERKRIEDDLQTQLGDLQQNSTRAGLERQSELLRGEQETASQRLEIYKQLAQAGAASESQVRAEIEQRYNLQVKAAELQEQLVRSQTDDLDKIAQAERAAAVAKVTAENDKQRAIEETTEALKAQKKEQASATSLDLGGGPYSLDKFFQNQSGFLDLTPAKKGANPKELARQRSVLDAMNKSKSPADVKSAVDAGGSAAAQAGEGIKRFGLALELFMDGEKKPFKVRKATVDGKGAEVEEAGRNL